MAIRQSRLERALASPAKVFDRPEGVLADRHLTHDQKEQILRQWEQDARQLQIAEGEAMIGGEESMLQTVLHALDRLGRR